MNLRLLMKRSLPMGNKASRRVSSFGARSPRGRRLLSFLVFLLASAGWWLVTSLEERYQKVITIPLEYPDLLEFAPDGDLPEMLQVTIEDTGFSILFNYTFFSIQPIKLDVEVSRARRDQRLFLSSALLNQSVQTRLESNTTKIIAISPNEIDYKLSRLESKVVPIENRVQVEFSDGHLLKNLTLEPATVAIYGSRDQLHKIKRIYTDSVVLRQEGENIIHTMPVGLIGVEGVRLGVPKVLATAEFVKFTEKVLELPIEVEHKPEGVSLTLLPSRAQLRVAIPMSMYNTVTPEDFTLMVDYQEIFASDSMAMAHEGQVQFFTVYLMTPPEWLINYRITPARIQFIRESGVHE